jgi:DNA-binding winged helix-turn-helix (wHTH) protein
VNQDFKLGPWVVRPSLNSLSRNAHNIRLEPKAMEILVCLAQQDGNVVSKEKLIGDVWKETFVGDDALVRCISALRRALEDDPKAPRLIETIPKRGYRLLVKIQPLDNGQHNVWLLLRWPAILALPAIGIVALGVWFQTRHAPALTEKDPIVVADFVNTTGDTVFDDTLKQGLSVQLSQSPFLNLLSDQRVRETLRLMGRAPADALTEEVAREICVRSGSKVLLAGSISSLGSQYVIGLKAMKCDSGEVFAQEQVQTAGKEEVLKVLSLETTGLRRKLGESLSSIQRFDVPLWQVTTPSLDALKAFPRQLSPGLKKAIMQRFLFSGAPPNSTPTSPWRMLI